MLMKTIHILPSGEGWAVKKEVAAKRGSGVYPTQKKALDVAREMARRASAAQIVVHGRDGSFRLFGSHGLPTIQTSRRKSDLGTQAIRRAVSAVIRERLAGQ